MTTENREAALKDDQHEVLRQSHADGEMDVDEVSSSTARLGRRRINRSSSEFGPAPETGGKICAPYVIVQSCFSR